jgi:hypothetical protein
MEGTQGPAEGWYDDPHDAGRLRWWDGTGWSDHTHEKAAPAAEPEPVSTQNYAATQSHGNTLPPEAFEMPTPTAAGPGSSYGSLPWLIGVLVVLIVGALALALILGGDDESEPEVPPQDVTAVDIEAQALVRTAQTAMETYATDNNGSYEGAGPEQLAAIEPLLAEAAILSDGGEGEYTVTATSDSGTTFSITRGTDGTYTYTCSNVGQGGCPASGNWAEGL